MKCWGHMRHSRYLRTHIRAPTLCSWRKRTPCSTSGSGCDSEAMSATRGALACCRGADAPAALSDSLLGACDATQKHQPKDGSLATRTA